MYNSASTIREGVEANTGAKVLKAKLALNWTDPCKILAVGHCSAAETPDGSPLGGNFLYLDLPSNLPGSDARRRVRLSTASPAPTSTTAGTCPNTYRRG